MEVDAQVVSNSEILYHGTYNHIENVLSCSFTNARIQDSTGLQDHKLQVYAGHHLMARVIERRNITDTLAAGIRAVCADLRGIEEKMYSGHGWNDVTEASECTWKAFVMLRSSRCQSTMELMTNSTNWFLFG